MKQTTINKLKSKTALFWLDGFLPLTPILSFVIIGIIFSSLNISTNAGWLAVIIPISFTGIWAVWYYAIRSKLNIPETQPLFWRVFGQYF
jgi:hypothetical protein